MPATKFYTCFLSLLFVILVFPLVAFGAGNKADFVLFVTMDGLRGDAFIREDTPAMTLLREAGAWTDSAKTIDLTLTLPAHATLLSGYGLNATGVTWNYMPENSSRQLKVPSLFHLLHRQLFSTAAFFNKKKLIQLMDVEHMDAVEYCGWNPKKAAAKASEYLLVKSPHLLFLHLAEPDSSGHRDGWMSPGYHQGVRNADKCLAQVLNVLLETNRTRRTLIVVASDHGGSGKKHGKTSKEETTVPLLFSGNMIKPGKLPDGISITSVVPTILWALGAEIPSEIEGRVLHEIFSEQLSSGL